MTETDTITGGPPATAPCGCPVDEAAQGVHDGEVCLRDRVLGLANAALPHDPAPDRRAAPIADLGEGRAVSLDLVPDWAVLNLDSPHARWHQSGLWQRQGDRIVPITLDNYRDAVTHCWAGSCGECRGCTDYTEFLTNRISDLTVLGEAVEKALGAVTDAARTFKQLGLSDIDDDVELSSVDAQDAQDELAAAERSLRHVWRIVGPHLTTIQSRKG